MGRLKLSILFWSVIGGLAVHDARAVGEAHLQPTGYSGPRNGNPYLQAYFGADFKSQTDRSRVWIRYESELIGTRHDYTFDVDRAYFRAGDFVIGRAHPWELAGFNAAEDRWGMLAQFQPINLGIQLDPVLLAPLGVHYGSPSASDPNAQTRFAISFSPIAVPNLGSEVSLNENSVSTNRFGRLPPGSVLVGASALPIRYQIDAGNIFTDVLLKPHLSGVVLHRVSRPYLLAVGGSIAPDPNAQADVASNFVRVATEDVVAVAVVKPAFPYRGQGFVSNQWSLVDSNWKFELNGLLRSDNTQAVEVLTRFQEGFYLGLSHAFPRTLYLDHLLRVGGQLRFDEHWSVESGIKTELTAEQSVWVNAKVSYRDVQTQIGVFLGADLFGGEAGTYFGEWRTNDRLYGGMSAQF